jgi:hypothetical protein
MWMLGNLAAGVFLKRWVLALVLAAWFAVFAWIVAAGNGRAVEEAAAVTTPGTCPRLRLTG